jgi:peptidoglycan/xylan/chitin deacetylase (PgdA/CDA1 family)
VGISGIRRRAPKRLLFDVLDRAGLNSRALRRHGSRDRLLILNLHSVSTRSNPYGPSVHPDALTELLAWLEARATFCLLGDLPGPADRDPRRPLVVLSFDDGLADFTEHAMPVLASHGLRANLNVIGHAAETGEPPWAIRVLDLLGAADAGGVQRLRVPGFNQRLAAADQAAKERYGAALTSHLKRLAPPARAPIRSAIEDALRDVEVEHPTRMMSVEDVAAARAAGHEIGSHSYSHESMEYLDDPDFVEDYRRSCEVLKRAGCPDCAVYAYPNGSHRAGQSDLLRREGVRHILLVGERASRPEATEHTRLTLRGSSAAELRARTSHGRGPR